MMHFEWPWALFFLPLPLLARFLLSAPRSGQAALKVPFIADFEQQEKKTRRRLSASPWLLALAVLAWMLLVSAAVRPQWVNEISQVTVSGRDLMLAVDISDSMNQRDFILGGRRVNRLEAAKSVAAEFIERRRGDRIGLIVFGTRPYLQMPLSFDIEAVREMLDATFIGLAEKRSTAIGDTIGLALKRLREYEESNRVLILLTDGTNNAGNLDPVSAAKIAGQKGMKIYTIGIGSPASRSLRLLRSSDLDEKTLKAIARETGGRYFLATNVDQLREIYKLLDQLEAIERDRESFRIHTELFPWPLAAALLLATILLFAHARPGREG